MSCLTNSSKYCINIIINNKLYNKKILFSTIPPFSSILKRQDENNKISVINKDNSSQQELFHCHQTVVVNSNYNNCYFMKNQYDRPQKRYYRTSYQDHQRQQHSPPHQQSSSNQNYQNTNHGYDTAPTSLKQQLFNYLLKSTECFSLFKKNPEEEEEETPEGKLIMTIKRSILCMQREEWNKAEQMLHLALRMAQDLQSHDGVTYVYDIMANLAMETEQFQKAETLFVVVMQRLKSDGLQDDDIKLLHISSKLAHMAAVQGYLDKANIGFEWTLEKLNGKRKGMPDDEDLNELFGIIQDCYGQLLMQLGKFMDAYGCFTDAFNIYTQIHGRNNSEVVLLLNNLGVVCTNLNDLVAAEVYLTEALELVKSFPELESSGIFQANRGILLMKQGLMQQAKTLCSYAWRLATNSKNKNGSEQANYCLKELENITV